MKLDDIIALAKNGYKPSDIKELIELASVTESETIPEDNNNLNNTTGSPIPPEPTEEAKEDVIDYKKLYEESQQKLKAAQAANRSIDSSGTIITDEETALDFVKGFF